MPEIPPALRRAFSSQKKQPMNETTRTIKIMTTRHSIPTLFAAGAAMSLAVLPLSAAKFGKFTYEDNGSSITITDYPTTATGAVDIPASIDGKPVTHIGDHAFNDCSGMTYVTIPSTVTHIGNYAFSLCYGMKTSVTIPSGVTSIGQGAFYYCSGLKSVIIENGVTSIGGGMFYLCFSLTSLTIPNSITSIGDLGFQDCRSLTSVAIPSSVTSIGNAAFKGCSTLTTAQFAGNAPTMGTTVFNGVAPGFKINYFTGKTGFTSPTWLGYPCEGVAAPPEIDVQQPLGTSLMDGTTKKRFGTVVVGLSGRSKKFTIKNTGSSDLTGLLVSVGGTNAEDFILTPPTKTKLVPGASTVFKITFKPTVSGTRSAVIRIKSNDADENPFDIKLGGAGAVP